jgi:uncharacterized protein YbjT (DUF2867 family)
MTSESWSASSPGRAARPSSASVAVSWPNRSLTHAFTATAARCAGQPVRALVRAGREPKFPAGVQPVAGDLNQPESMRPALAGAQALFLYPGYQDMAGTLAEARQAGVRLVVMLSGSSAAGGDMDNAVSRYMIDSEAAVRDSGLAWTVVRSFGFMSNTLQWIPQLRAGDVVRAEMSAAMPAAYVDAFFDFYVKGTLDESQPRPDVDEVTGRPPRTFRQWAQAHAGLFESDGA